MTTDPGKEVQRGTTLRVGGVEGSEMWSLVFDTLTFLLVRRQVETPYQSRRERRCRCLFDGTRP